MSDPLNDLWTSSAPAIDVDALAKRAAASRARQKRLFFLEGLATALVVVFWGALLFRAATPAVIAMSAASGVALAAWWSFLVKNQRGTWSSSSMSAAEFLALERARLRAAARHARMNTIGVCAITAVVLLTMPVLWSALPVYREEPWRLGVAALIACATLAATLVVGAVRSRRIEKARRELDDVAGLAGE